MTRNSDGWILPPPTNVYKHEGLVSAPTDNDNVEHPKHYCSHPAGVECIEVTEHFNFNIGNAIKYLWRAGLKGEKLEDLKKALWYVKREIQRIEKESK